MKPECTDGDASIALNGAIADVAIGAADKLAQGGSRNTRSGAWRSFMVSRASIASANRGSRRIAGSSLNDAIERVVRTN
jgi:hypothetical protein